MGESVYKSCGCGKTFATRAALETEAKPLGPWQMGDLLLQIFNCPCGSTIAIDDTPAQAGLDEHQEHRQQ